MLTLSMVGAGAAVTEPSDIPRVETETFGGLTVIPRNKPNIFNKRINENKDDSRNKENICQSIKAGNEFVQIHFEHS